MGWWKRFNDWVDRSIDQAAREPLKDWDPGEIIPFRYDPPTQAECSDAEPNSTVAVETAGPSSKTPGESDPVSDEKNEPGGGTKQYPSEMPEVWYHCETIQGEPPKANEPLEHASSLPSTTFRVFPTATNHRNVYDTEASVRRAVAARKSRPYYGYQSVRVYRAETVWRDVTEDYVKR